jgi:hypothetical protein
MGTRDELRSRALLAGLLTAMNDIIPGSQDGRPYYCRPRTELSRRQALAIRTLIIKEIVPIEIETPK